TPMDRTLIDALEQADMLEVEGLHAFEFDLYEVEADDDIEVEIRAMEGKQQICWAFSRAELLAARYDEGQDLWGVSQDGKEYWVRRNAACTGEGEDDSAAPPRGRAPAASPVQARRSEAHGKSQRGRNGTQLGAGDAGKLHQSALLDEIRVIIRGAHIGAVIEGNARPVVTKAHTELAAIEVQVAAHPGNRHAFAENANRGVELESFALQVASQQQLRVV